MLQPGQLIDVWVVEKAIGSGGMGSVYRCHNRHATRILAAIKTLEGAVRRIPEAEQRFIREAEILFSVDHPNVVKVRNVRLDLDTPYLEMEFVEGESLEERLCRGPLPLDLALELTRQLLDAIVYLHDKGIRHRDIKPANLLINKEGRLKLVDFGLASEADVSRITRANTTFGTVSYAPPEWVRPNELDPESWDIYAAGVVFWEMLTARVAFPGSPHVDPRQVAIQIMAIKQTHPPLDPGGSYQDDLRQLCRDMTQSDHKQRIGTAREALKRLTRLDGSLASSSVSLPPGLPGRERQPTDYSQSVPEVAGRKNTQQPELDEATRKRSHVPSSTPSGSRRRGNSGEPSVEPPPGRALTIAGVLMGALAVVIVLGAAGVLGWRELAQPAAIATSPTRDVDVVVAGLPRGTDVALRLGDAAATSTNGFMHRFASAPVGGTRLAWAVGQDCTNEACPGESCPSWCAQGVEPFDVLAGAGVQFLNLELVPPSPRAVRVDVPAVKKHELSGVLGETDARVEGGALRFEAVAPGPHLIEVVAGSCPEESTGCDASGTCPPGCSSWKGELVVPAGQGEFAWTAPLREPVQAAVQAVEPSKAKVTPPVAGARSGRLVSNADFAAWVESRPEWQRDEAIAAGKADTNYLMDWKDGAAPGGAGQPVTAVSWAAAAAYCSGRGGLAALDAPPLKWNDAAGEGPYIEWRSKDGAPAWRRSDGAESTNAKRSESNAWTGFRCAR